ncbi:hypothetical protein CBL_06144 [Carabus blaptoides fortunei]
MKHAQRCDPRLTASSKVIGINTEQLRGIEVIYCQTSKRLREFGVQHTQIIRSNIGIRDVKTALRGSNDNIKQLGGVQKDTYGPETRPTDVKYGATVLSSRDTLRK